MQTDKSLRIRVGGEDPKEKVVTSGMPISISTPKSVEKKLVIIKNITLACSPCNILLVSEYIISFL